MFTNKKWYMVTISSVLYGISIVCPVIGQAGVFLFLIPLFYMMLENPYSCSWKEGLYWGILTYSMQYWGIIRFILDYGEGHWRLIAGILFVLYSAWYAALWFGMTTIMITRINHQSIRIYSSIIPTLLFFFWTSCAQFFIFGTFEGNCFSNPLLPLASNARWLVALPVLGVFPLIGCLILTSISSAYALYTLRMPYVLGSLLFLTPFLYGWIMQPVQESRPSWLDSIGIIMPSTIPAETAWEQACTITEDLYSLIKTNSQIHYIIAPESTYAFPLNRYQDCIAMWTENCLHDDVHFVLGSHRCDENNTTYNSLYHMHKGRIIKHYDKNHTMFFTEYVAFPWNYIPWCSDLFLHKKTRFSVGTQERPLLCIDTITMIPYICSDLFFSSYTKHYEFPLLCIVNDHWFAGTYIKTLMCLDARLKALAWSTDILYVGHEEGIYNTKHGNQWIIKA